MKNKTFCLFLICLLLIFFTSCSKNKMGIPANLTNVENVMASGEWAVITIPYASFREEPFETSEIINHGRRGDICVVLGKRIQKNDKTPKIWYNFAEGWISESDLSIYSNKLQAEFAASQL